MKSVSSKASVAALILLAAPAAAATTTAHAWDAPMCALDPEVVAPNGMLCAEPPSELPMCASAISRGPHAIPRSEAFVLPTDARDAYLRTLELMADARYGEALLALRVVETAYPRIADRLALIRGEIELASGDARAAVGSFDEARASLDPSVAIEARVAKVRALIALDPGRAGGELVSLMRRYPDLPQALALRLELADARDQAGDVNEAVRVYREIDLGSPGSAIAVLARERLEEIRARGVEVRELNLVQRVDRAERLVSSGPMGLARAEVEALLEERLTPDLRTRIALGGARIARIEGRWEDAQRYLAMAHGGPVADEEALADEEAQAEDVHRAAHAREQETARRAIAQLKGRSAWSRVPALRLRNIVEIAARAGLTEETDAALGALAAQSSLHPQVAFDSALMGSGVGSDVHIEVLFGKVVSQPRFRTAARYHRARALERLGRWVEAELEYLTVADSDTSETGWYALLAEQRLWTVHAAMLCRCQPSEVEPPELLPEPADAEPVRFASLTALPDAARRPHHRAEGTRTEPREPIVPPAEPDLQALAERLEPVIETHGEAFPWLGRAQDLLRLGQRDAAADELHEAYLAWRDARGTGLIRVGTEAVYRGADAPRRFGGDWQTRRMRRDLPETARAVLVDVTSAVGDEGTAVGFGGWARVAARPRAYESLVREVAARHGLDPNLLLAVMRVESVYQRRIVSYAGAVGLMQIMPRTGRLIASAVGRDDYTTADLLDAETNLDFAAWYLASLIERFDGRLPLAIASYNGGPHNVRRWMREYAATMPLDAFLEFIPFDQTHRYVRRVLGHYAAYREQENLPMERLTLVLPDPGPDTVGF
jgi:soluble lytic murein transglycosylase